MGRALLLLTGVLTIATAPALHLDARAWLTLSVVSATMIVAVAVSLFTPWERMTKTALLGFPTLVFFAFIALSVGEHAAFAPLSGFYTLCYGYAGLTQRPRTSLLLVAPSSTALIAIYGGLTAPIVVRLLVATSVWVILAEVLAGFTARHAQLSEALQRAAFNDALTGLPNRRDLDKQLTVAAPGTGLVICDLDHFKQLNDTQGHSAGDHVLADFGNALRAVLRVGDYSARFGGDEFLLLLPHTDPLGTEAVLERLRQNWSLLQPGVTFSAGAAQCHSGRTPAETLAAADVVLYAAKAAGRHTTCHEATGSVPGSGKTGLTDHRTEITAA